MRRKTYEDELKADMRTVYGEAISKGALQAFVALAKAADRRPLTGDDIRRMMAKYVELKSSQ